MTLDEVRDVLRDVKFPAITFQLTWAGEMPVIQACGKDEQGNWQRGRKWRVSTHMTRSEIVQTCFLALKTWNEHELREKFTYKGKAIFGPHLDVETLLSVADALDARKEPGGL